MVFAVVVLLLLFDDVRQRFDRGGATMLFVALAAVVVSVESIDDVDARPDAVVAGGGGSDADDGC